MKRILVPVDFSVAAANALRYALNFSKPFGAEIICLHVTKETSAHAEALSKLQKFIAENSLAASSRITVKNVVVNGILGNAVSEFLERKSIDLIVMGTKGAMGFQKVLSGSNTTDLLSSTSIPILIVPQGFAFSQINIILWASDFLKLTHSKALNPLVETALTYNAEVRIAHVKASDKHGSLSKHFETSHEHHYLEHKGVKHSLKKISGTDIVGGINYYLQKKGDNDILVMVRRKHGFLSRIFRRDHTYEFACNPTLPLLILPE
jgi:nucleotide-binding universal stress UspA family protein